MLREHMPSLGRGENNYRKPIYLPRRAAVLLFRAAVPRRAAVPW